MNLTLKNKFSTFFILLFLIGIVISGLIFSQMLQWQAATEVTDQAKLLLTSMNSVRSYTSEQIKNQLIEYLENDTFIPETVPAYGARQVFENFRQTASYDDFLYKEATLNPTNPQDQADTFETNLVDKFRQTPTQTELQGYRLQQGKKQFFLARPLKIQKAGCLECHGHPANAPASLIHRYGDKNGFGWKLNEIVAAQIIYVPADAILARKQKYFRVMMFVFILAFTTMIVFMTRFFQHQVVDPLKILTLVTRQMGAPIASGTEKIPPNTRALFQIVQRHDEIGQLTEAFHQMRQQVIFNERHLSQAKQQLEETNFTLEQKVQNRTQEIEKKNHSLEKTLTQLRQTQAQLIQTEKMSSLGELVAGIAHEINNPVNFISGNLQSTQTYVNELFLLIQAYQTQHPDTAPEVEELIDSIELEFLQTDLPKALLSMKAGAERIATIVASLRNFSRLDESAQKSVDLHKGLESTLTLLNGRLQAQGADIEEIQVIKDYGTLPKVYCNASEINQVFMHLLLNAIEALEGKRNPKQNDLKKSTQGALAQADPQACIRLCTSTDEQYCHITISDNGCGIPYEIQTKIFDPFFTTKPVGRGTGLGLSVAYQVITQRHKGQLACQSTPNAGTCFTIRLPIAVDKE